MVLDPRPEIPGGRRCYGGEGLGVPNRHDNGRAAYAQLRAQGVAFLWEPTERAWGIEATFRDNSGNWFSMTERVEAPTTA